MRKFLIDYPNYISRAVAPYKALFFTVMACLWLAGCIGTPSFNGHEIESPKEAPQVVFEIASGKELALGPDVDSLTLIFFGYTSCPDICPTTLADWKRLKTKLGSRADRLRFAFVSVDTDRDSKEAAETYALAFDPDFRGVVIDSSQIQSITEAFGISSYRDNPPPHVEDIKAYFEEGKYTVTHSSQSFLIDRKGVIRLIFPYGMPVDKMAEDIRRL